MTIKELKQAIADYSDNDPVVLCVEAVVYDQLTVAKDHVTEHHDVEGVVSLPVTIYAVDSGHETETTISGRGYKGTQE